MVKLLRLVWMAGLCLYFASTVFPLPSSRKYGAPDVKVTSPAHFRELKETIPYEATAKLIVKVPLPEFGQIPIPSKQKKLYQMSFDTIKIFLDDFNTYIEGLRNVQKEKRQLLVGIAGATIGYMVHSIYTRIASKLAGSETEATAHVHQLWQALRVHRKEFLYFETQVAEYSNNLTSTFDKLFTYMNDYKLAQIASLHLQQLQIVIGKIHRGLNRCLHYNIPVELIGVIHLEKSIKSLEENLTQYGYKLAIDPKNIVRLERLSVADCFVTRQTLYVLINLPVTKTDWKILQLLPVPFAFNSQTCVLAANSDILAVSLENVKVISSYMLSFCDFRRDFLCLVPDIVPKDHSSACANNLYNGAANKNEITTSPCKFECKNNMDPFVIQIEKNKIVVTNVKVISVQCPSKKYVVKSPQIGALEITIVCSCNYNLDGDIINGDSICVQDAFTTMSAEDVVHILPDFLVSTGNSLNSDTVLTDWPKHVPVLNYTPATEIPLLEQYAGPVQYRDWMLFLILIVVVVVIIFNLIICHCWRKLKIST